jgi:hypothetical protein
VRVGAAAAYDAGGAGRCGSFDTASLQLGLSLSVLLRRHIISSRPSLPPHTLLISAAQAFMTAARAACISGDPPPGDWAKVEPEAASAAVDRNSARSFID